MIGIAGPDHRIAQDLAVGGIAVGEKPSRPTRDPRLLLTRTWWIGAKYYLYGRRAPRCDPAAMAHFRDRDGIACPVRRVGGVKDDIGARRLSGRLNRDRK